MTIVLCNKCSICISISMLKGGNPIARAHADMFALRYGKCNRCGGYYCEKCIMENQHRCPGCNRKIEVIGPKD